ncbi:MAG: hypothetical protein ACOCZH_00215 [Phototrophicaceae bacterium]
MRLRLGAAFASAITITVGLITLAGLLLRDDLGLPAEAVQGVREAADLLLQLTTITVAVTIVIGVVNLVTVHLRRITGRTRGALYSLVLLASFLLVVVSYIADRESSMILLETVQRSVESALAGVLFFALVYGAYRMQRDRVSWTSMLFITVLLVVLLAALPLGGLDVVQDVRDWLIEIPVSAGARGLLLGIALGTIVAGMRVLIGVDRSYRE